MVIEVTEPGRVDKIMASALPQYSRSALSKLFDEGNVLVGSATVRPGHKVKADEIITVDLSPLEIEQQVVELPVIYEDADIVVVDKPSGIISHARGKYWYEPSVASFIRKHVAGLTGERAGIVHRLDRATSGVMICAKNESALKFLQKQFSDRAVLKTYVAVVSGAPLEDEAIVDAPIERNPKKPSTFRIGANGKSAQTFYKVIQKGKRHSLLEFKPKTGRTHQIRLHSEYIKCPIVGDVLYGGEDAGRLMLHASSLKIKLPSGEIREFTSPLPKEFYEVV